MSGIQIFIAVVFGLFFLYQAHMIDRLRARVARLEAAVPASADEGSITIAEARRRGALAASGKELPAQTDFADRKRSSG